MNRKKSLFMIALLLLGLVGAATVAAQDGTADYSHSETGDILTRGGRS